MSSKPGPAVITGLSREEIVKKIQQGQIKIENFNPGLGSGQQQPRLIRIVSSAAGSQPMRIVHTVSSSAQGPSTMVTPIKVLQSVAPSGHGQPLLSSLSSPHLPTRTIKIGSPRPPVAGVSGARTSTPQKTVSSLVSQASSLPSSLPSPGVVDLGARGAKRQEIDFETFSDSKRRKTDKGGKGLRHFSMKVCEKVKAKGTTSYNEVADELVAELTDPRCQSPSDQQYDQKNIRRRVYDALNVLMAMNIISKEKKEIRWLGLPTNSVQEATSLETEKAKRIDRIKAKTEQLQDLMLQQIAFKKLVERNKEAEKNSRRPTPNSVIEIPFIIVSTNQKTVIECQISSDKKEYLFEFDNTFEIHEDTFVLQKMGMTMGLEKGEVSEEDLRAARSMVPRALEPYVAQLARHGPGSCTIPKVTSPKPFLVKEDPDSPKLLEQDDEDEESE